MIVGASPRGCPSKKEEAREYILNNPEEEKIDFEQFYEN